MLLNVTYDVMFILVVNRFLDMKVAIDLSNNGSFLCELIYSLSGQLMKDLSRHN